MKKTLPLGETYRYFRTSKNFALKEAAKDCISISQLSNFENGRSHVSCLVLLYLLNNINVSPHEFFHHLNVQLNPWDWFEERHMAHLNSNMLHLQKIIQRYEKSLIQSSPSTQRLEFDKFRLEATMKQLDSHYHLSPKSLTVIKHYLKNIKIWGEYEFDLLSDIAVFLDLGTLSKFSHKILKTARCRNIHPLTQKAQLRSVINVLEIFIKKRQKYLAEELLYFISTFNMPEDDLFDRVNFIYQKAFFEVSFGDTSAVKTMKKCQYFFELCGSYQIAQKLEQEIKSLETLIKSRKPR
jgi:transcriptional activator, Rgg/GadR/MutR family, C-terminal domain